VSDLLRRFAARPGVAAVLVAAFIVLGASACRPPALPEPQPRSSWVNPPASAWNVEGHRWVRPDLRIGAISAGVLLHTSTKQLPEWGLVESNGLVVLGGSAAIVVDTAWDDGQTAALFDYVEQEFRRKPTQLVVTHSHDDRMGGVREALRRGLVVHGLETTAERAIAAGLPPPTHTFASDVTLSVEGRRIEAYFPGAAHAPDNLVVWVPDAELLFGTCMIRAGDATSLGNLADASLSDWAGSVRALQRRFPKPVVVVPGHGLPGSAALLEHTIALAEAEKARVAARPPP
jgi:metallo-beta-lactamase class B